MLALCIAGTANGMAQDLKSILSGVANAVANKVTGESASLTGTWAYVGPDCKFESDNLLAKAGGEVAAKQVEDKMSGVLRSWVSRKVQPTPSMPIVRILRWWVEKQLTEHTVTMRIPRN